MKGEFTLEIKTTTVKHVKRASRVPGGINHIANYFLCQDESPRGHCFYYIKCHLERWDGPQVVAERMGVSGELGSDRDYAQHLFLKIARALPVVQPEHLQDIVRDETLGWEQSRQPGWRQERPGVDERQKFVLVR